jgi:circadian clock protein KaiC
MNKDKGNAESLARTGTSGLDEILHGGFTRGMAYLIEGQSGTGKTMLAVRFALEGIEHGESGLYITLSETHRELKAIIERHGWKVGNLQILETTTPGAKYTIFHPSEVELGEIIKRLKEEVERVHPLRLVIDSLTEIRLLTQSSLRFRREVLGFRQFMVSCECTMLLLDEPGFEASPRSLVDGVLVLEHLAPDYGADRRRLRMLKMRGRAFDGGYHDFVIRKGGLQVFPRLAAAEHPVKRKAKALLSGIASLDKLFGGGLLEGSSTLLLGPAGTGKSSVAMRFALSAAERCENAIYFTFDERPEFIIRRSSSVRMSLDKYLKAGRLRLQQINPAELSPGEFAHTIRREIETREPAVLVIDSLNGYIHAMPDERYLTAHLHELLTYLGQQNVATFLVMGQSGIIGTDTPANAGYLTDNVLLFRFFESDGEVHRAISVLKRRAGGHERTMRELLMGPDGIAIGEPLREFQGVLTGIPTFTGVSGRLMQNQNVKRK